MRLSYPPLEDSMLDVRPARNALKLVRVKLNILQIWDKSIFTTNQPINQSTNQSLNDI
jgi:hypothetical protein